MKDFDYSATYSVEDNKIRIYPFCEETRMSNELYNECKSKGFSWAPIQKLFVTQRWTPEAEDFALKVAGEIDREETTILERAQAKSERLDALANKRANESIGFYKAAQRLSDRFSSGQPILIGHHSEKRARRDKKKLDSAISNSICAANKVLYWNYRAEGVERHANYKNSDRVRVGRIKKLLADLRKYQKQINDAEMMLTNLEKIKRLQNQAEKKEKIQYLSGFRDFGFDCYDLLIDGSISHEDALDKAIERQEKIINSDYLSRFIVHTLNRLGYEREMLGVVYKYEGTITPTIIQYFARTYGVEKPKAKKTDFGFLLSSPVQLPYHIGEGKELHLSDDNWRNFMCDLGHEVPPEKPKKAPILNFRFENLEIKRPYGNKIFVNQVEMTKKEYSEIHSEYRGVSYSTCGTFRVKVFYPKGFLNSSLTAAFISDSKVHDAPISDSINANNEKG